MKKRKFIFFKTFIFAIMLFLGVIILSKCTFKAPSQPVWDVNFIIPLINKHYTMEELAEDSDDLIIDQQNESIIFRIDDEIDRFEIGENLKTGNAEASIDVTVPDGVQVGWSDTRSGDIVMPAEIVLERAVVQSGFINLEIDNQTGYQGTVDIEIPSFTLQGVILTESLPLAAGGSQSFSIPLDFYTIQPRIAGGRSHIDFDGTVTIDGIQNPTGGDFGIHVGTSEIVFKEVTGTLNEVEVPIDTVDTEMDIPEELEGFEIESAELELRFMLGFQVPVWLDFLIEGLEPRGQQAAPIQIDELVVPDARGEATVLVPNLADMINSQPQRILMTGSVRIGDGSTSATIYDTTSFTGSFEFQAPLIFSIPSQETKAEVDTLELDEDTRERIRDNLIEISIATVLENHLPISADITIYFSGSRGDNTLYDGNNADLTIGPIGLAPATLDGDPSVVTIPDTSHYSQTLTKNDGLDLFEGETLYFGIKFNFNGTQDEMVKIRPSDYIHVQARGEAVVRTKFPDKDDEEGGGS